MSSVLIPLILFATVSVPKVKIIDGIHPHEIAAVGSLKVSSKATKKSFLSCVPRESIPYKKEKELDELFSKAFALREREDLMECRMDKCAFNFLSVEKQVLQQLQSLEDRKKMFVKFYQNRVDRLTPVDSARAAYFIHSKDKAFEECEGNALHTVLDDRPMKKPEYRISISQYSEKMRPTTRLLQAASFEPKPNTFCYVEALLFSDHYDEDRVEMWKLSGGELQLKIRHRIDMLNSKTRRFLNKGKLETELKHLIESQLDEAADCLKSKH